MQHYKFPVFTHIDEVKYALDGHDEFSISVRDGYKVIDYHYVSIDSFPPINDNVSILRREFRGLLFDENGNVIGRRFHKFFNLGEREETLPANVDFTNPHHILLKEDGSMMSPYKLNGEIVWGTMMGHTDFGIACEDFIAQSGVNYNGFTNHLLTQQYNPIFEWCNPATSIVIRHKEKRLVLTGIRHLHTGEYYSFADMVELANKYNIPVVKEYGQVDCPSEEFMEKVHNNTDGIEGFVVQFDSGHRIKVKTEWYVRQHKAKDNITIEKNVWSVILNDEIDDLLPLLSIEDGKTLVQFAAELRQAMAQTALTIRLQYYDMYEESGDNRAKYAELVKGNPNLIGGMKGMAFRMYSNPAIDPLSLVTDYAIKNIGSATKIEIAKSVIDVRDWVI